MAEFSGITTERLHLRILGENDSTDFFGYRSLPEVGRYQGWRPVTLHEIEGFIASNLQIIPNTPGTWLQLAVCLREGQLIGDVGIHFLENAAQVEIGYTLSPVFQGKGYAVEAVRAVMDYLFHDLHKHRITASVDPENLKSIKLLEKLGMRKEAHFVCSFRLGDTWCDDCIYAILENEWQ
jgi:RimJ/RimL family protein N-acetyltransferase